MRIKSRIAQQLVNKSDFNFVKIHLLNHHSDHICQLGNLTNVSSELPERVMMDLKQAYRQSNRNQAAFQIFSTKSRMEVCQYQELNVQPAKRSCKDDMPLNKVPIKWMMKYPSPDIKTLDDFAKLCAMPKGELQSHIAWCFKRFANFTDYVHHEQYFSCCNDWKYIQYREVTIPVTSFQCNEFAVHMVHLALATVPGYLASVRVGTNPKAPDRVRNRQVTRPALSWRGCYPDRTETCSFLAGLNPDCGSILRFLQLCLQLSISVLIVS